MLLKVQRGKCAICGRALSGLRILRSACLDHDHKTGEIRGVLCHPCNLVIGNAKDSIAVLEKAVSYLRFFEGERIW